MIATDVIKNTLVMGDYIQNEYLKDLSDAELLVRPIEGMNPIAWQIGHLIESERDMLEKLKPGSAPALPAGFAAAHSKEAALAGGTSGYLKKAEYEELGKKLRAASLVAIESLDAAVLDEPSGIEYAPTKGALANMLGVHVLMHVGQFAAVRRALKKPVVI